MSEITGGILVVDKPAGPTSHDVVAMVRRALGMRRIGHCGTLDPLATGVLILCVGKMTRLSDCLTGGSKEYEATFRLGARSDTDDADGEITPVPGASAPGVDEVDLAMARYRGTVEQLPPEHSAIRVDGVRSYHRARRQQATRLTPRPVHIGCFERRGYHYPHLEVRVACGKGTYIRAMARDLGTDLGCGAHVEALRRTRVGELTVDDAVAPQRLEMEREACFVEPRRALEGILAGVELASEAAHVFGHGGAVATDESAPGERAVYSGGELIGLGRIDADGGLRPLKVFAEMAPVGE